MAISRRPKAGTEKKAADFIAAVEAIPPLENKQPIMIRIDPDLLKRIDAEARRLGISRSAFIVQGAAKQLEE